MTTTQQQKELTVLKNKFGAEFYLALDIISGISPKDLIMGKLPTEEELQKLIKIFEERKNTNKPLAQILGVSYFMGEKFKISSATLIPRPETELLVKKSIDIINTGNYKKILDIGTGSGCIACMIAKKTNAQVLGLDISNDALQIALENAMNLNLVNKAIFRKSDIYSKIDLINNENFDMIVSNPPYIPPQEKEKIMPEVKDYEPQTALFTNDSKGIEFYEKIIKDANKYLKPNGHIGFEIGQYQAQPVTDLLEKYNFDHISVYKDVSGIERTITAQQST